MTKLHMQSISAVDDLAWPEAAEPATWDSPALEFFTDFSEIEPLVIDASVSAVHARELMVITHVRLKLVVQNDKGFLGVISADDLSEQNILQRSASLRVARSEILVKDLMTFKNDLHALSLSEVTHASISDVVEVLKHNYQQHCLVVDQTTHKIRGIFSASDISRKLRLPINIQDHSNFYRVFAAAS